MTFLVTLEILVWSRKCKSSIEKIDARNPNDIAIPSSSRHKRLQLLSNPQYSLLLLLLLLSLSLSLSLSQKGKKKQNKTKQTNKL
jgi:hypothetical protein